MIKFGKKKTILASVTGFVLVAATAAFAAWILTASSTHWTAKTGSLQAISFSTTAYPPVGTLLPGGTTAIKADVNNPNSAPVTIRSATGPADVNSAILPGGCSPAAFTVDTSAFVGVTIPSGQSTVVIPAALSMASSASESCQGAMLDVNLNSLSYGVGQ